MDLYALAPEDFTAARDAEVKQAKAAGDRERARQLGLLRRPSLSAYAVNALSRTEPAGLRQLLALAEELAAAQQAGRGDLLRAGSQRRHRLLAELTERAEVAAGRQLSEVARGEVLATLTAALAEPASAALALSGRLVRPLSYAGFGPVDLAGAVAPELPPTTPSAQPADRQPADPQPAPLPAGALPASGPAAAPRRAARAAVRAHRSAVRAAEAEVQTTAGQLDDAVAALRAAERTARKAAAEADAARQAEAAARAALVEATARQATSLAAQEATSQTVERLAREVQAAQRDAGTARTTLDALRRAGEPAG